MCVCVCVESLVRACIVLEVEGTDVFASTLHNVFDLDSAYNSNLDFTKTGTEKVGNLINMQVLLLDEAGRC